MNSLNWLLNSIVISAVLGGTLGKPSDVFENDNKAAYIVGGQQSQAFAYPFMVFVTDQRQQCGGTIVGRNLVVTAAHCIGSRNPSEYRVVGHRHNLQTSTGSEKAVTFQVKQVVVHPSYNTQSFDNDIALLVLNNDNPNAIQGADMDRMIQIDTQGPKEGGTTKVIGWGRTQAGGQASPVLKETELKVFNGETCRRMFGPFNPSYKICAGAIRQGDSACQGDSGGPLVSGNTLVGVVSHGAPNCNGPASVYTRVANYANWINQYRAGGSSQPQQPQQPQEPEQPEQPEQPQQPEQPEWPQQPQEPQEPEWTQQPQQPQWPPQQNWWQIPQQQEGWWEIPQGWFGGWF